MNTCISAIPGLKHRQLQPFCKERGEDVVVIKAGLGIPLRDPTHFQLPQSSCRCPAPASVLRVTLSPEDGCESLWRYSQRLSFARKGCSGSWGRCRQAWAFFPKDPDWKCPKWLPVHREWFSPPRTPETLTAAQMHQVLLCSCGHPLPCTLHSDWGSWSRPHSPPYLHFICMSYHMWKKYDGTSFENLFLESIIP